MIRKNEQIVSKTLEKIGLRDVLCPTCLYCRSISVNGVVTCMLNGKQSLKVFCADYEQKEEVKVKNE